MILLNHCVLAKLALVYGGLTAATGLLLYTQAGKVRGKAIAYIRLVHLLLGLITAVLGILAYLASP